MEVRESHATYNLDSSKFQVTDIGIIPREWRVASIGELAETSSGTTPPRSAYDRYYKGGTIAWVKTLDLNNSDIRSTDERVTPEALAETSLRIYPSGTVLVAMYGGLNQIGRTGLLNLPAAVNQALTAIRPRNGSVDSRYLLRVLNHRVDHWRSVASSSRKDPNITSKDVRDFALAIPRIEEQQAIAEALSDADALIESLSLLLAKKRQIKQGAMQELLTGKRRLPGFVEPWRDGPLGRVIYELVAGVSVNSNVGAGEVGVPSVVKTSALSAGKFRVFECKPIAARDLSRARVRPRRDTLLISRMNTPDLVGEIAYVDRDYNWLYLPDRIWMARSSGDVVSMRWLSYLLSSAPLRRAITDTATGTSGSMKNISKGALLAISVRYPPVEEQRAIAEVLADLDSDVASLEASLAKAREIKQGMAQALLSGRIRLVQPVANVVSLPLKPPGTEHYSTQPTHN